MDSIVVLPPSSELLIPTADDLLTRAWFRVRMNQSAGTVIISHLRPLPWLIFADELEGLMPYSIAGTHSVLEMSLVLVFLFATGHILHDAMSVRTTLVILLASIGLAYNF